MNVETPEIKKINKSLLKKGYRLKHFPIAQHNKKELWQFYRNQLGFSGMYVYYNAYSESDAVKEIQRIVA